MLGFGQWAVANHTHFGYLQQRPENDTQYYGAGGEQRFSNFFAGGGTIAMDCSEFVTLVCEFAGLNDPSGAGVTPGVGPYNGYGNSDSIWANLGAKSFTNPKHADVGSIVVFGPATKTVHVAFVAVRSDTDPQLISHGSSNGPILVGLNEYLGATGQQLTGFCPISTL
jgi:hypothetical protein